MDKPRSKTNAPLRKKRQAEARAEAGRNGTADKTIHVSADTHRRLKAMGSMGDTLDDVIVRLLALYDWATKPKRAAGRAKPKAAK